jgi:hypothetical protein
MTRHTGKTLAALGGTCIAVGQAFQPDISTVNLESLTYEKSNSGISYNCRYNCPAEGRIKTPEDAILIVPRPFRGHAPLQ